jgi:fibronectin-binding autotransporter adhesin
MRTTTTKSLVRTSFLLAAAAFSIAPVCAANITVTTGTKSIGTGGTATTATDIVTVNGGSLEVTTNSTIGGLSGTGGEVCSGFQNSAYTHSTLTVNVAAGESYIYNGTIRPNHYDGVSVNRLTFTKTGQGTQELAGVLIGYLWSPATKPVLNASGGVLKLSGAWGFDGYIDYSGAVNVNNGGTLEIARSWNYGSGNAFNQLSHNAQNILVSNGTLRFSGVDQSSARSFTVGSGGATLSVAEGISFSNMTGAQVGVISGSAGGNLTLGGESVSASLSNAVGSAGTWAAGAKLIKADLGTWTVAGVDDKMSGGLQVSQGTLVLTANSSYTAGTIIQTGGTLEVRGTLGSGTYAGSIANDGGLVFNSSSAQDLNGVISGVGSLETKGAGQLTLGASNTYAGDTIVTAGSLRLNHVDAIKYSNLVTNSAAGTVVFGVAAGTYNVGALSGNGTLALSDTAATPGAITLVTGNSNVAESFSGVLSGLGNLRKAGTNTLTLTGTNTYAGQTIVSSGTLALSGAGTLGSGVVQLNGGALDLGAVTVAFTNSVNFNGGVLTGGSMDVAQVASAQSGTVSTALTGTGGLTKTGAGLLVLGAGVTHTYSGQTLVNEGKLKLDGIIASSITVANGASLGGHGVINGNVSMSAGSTIAAGGSVGNLTVGSLTITSGTQVAWEVYDANGVAGVDYDKITVNGALDLSGLSGTNRATLVLSSLADPLANLPGNAGLFDASLNHTFTLFTYGSLNLGSNTDVTSLFSIDKSSVRDAAGVLVAGDFSLRDSGTSIDLVYASPVPEPSTYGLGLGFLALAAVAVRRQRRKAPAQT